MQIKLKKNGKLPAAQARKVRAHLFRIHSARNHGGTWPALVLRNGDLMRPDTGARLLACELVPIELGREVVRDAQDWGDEQWPRKQRWLTPEPKVQRQARLIDERKFHYRGSFKTYWGTDAVVLVRSFGAVAEDGRTLHIAYLNEPARALPAPRGYRWIRDRSGIALLQEKTGIEYHPTMSECLRGSLHIRSALLNKKRIRDENLAQETKMLRIIRRADRDGVYVSFADARAAGNCKPGISRYCSEHALDPRGHVRAGNLPEPERREVAAAIMAAIRRHRADLRRGYCRVGA